LKRLELAIDSDLTQVSLAAVAIHRVCLYLGLNDARAGEVELCVAEAVTNSIRHAYHGIPGNRVTIALAASSDRLLIEVCDTGSAMPLESQQRLERSLRTPEVQMCDRTSIPEGGRGLHIIRELMDEVSYTSKHQLNHLVMTKYLAEIPRHEA